MTGLRRCEKGFWGQNAKKPSGLSAGGLIVMLV
jgi:hypothetical protein